jgi:Anti-sigma-K factor rskA
MFGLLRSCARRLHRPGRPAVAQEAAFGGAQEPALGEAQQPAPGGLRRRVLGAVRGEVEPGSETRGRDPTLPIAAVIAATATIAAAVAVAFAAGQGSSAPGRPASHAAAGARAPHASLQRSGGRAELVISGMPEPPIGEVYELWLNRPGAPPQPTDALFMVTGSGDGWVQVPASLHGVREVMVTSEPLGGSSSPTSLAVLRVRVPGAR